MTAISLTAQLLDQWVAVRQCVGHRANLEGIIGLSLPHKASGFTIAGVFACLRVGITDFPAGIR
jgi:hypothetical protein